MEEGGQKLPRARELARMVFGEDLEALAGQLTLPELGRSGVWDSCKDPFRVVVPTAAGR